jgi:hypothetical protein
MAMFVAQEVFDGVFEEMEIASHSVIVWMLELSGIAAGYNAA